MNLFRPIAEAYGILFVRTILFILAIATVVIEAVTISIYNKRVASSPGILAPPSSSSHHYPLVINAVSLIPSLFSVIWSLAYLIIITRRLIQTHHRRREDSSSSSSAANEACNGGRRRSNTVAVLHPGLVISLDTISWIFFLVMAVLTGTQASNWKSGQVPTGSEGATTQVILSACPTFDQSTGVLNYWCDSPSWGEVVELTTSATSLLGTLTYVSSSSSPFSNQLI